MTDAIRPTKKQQELLGYIQDFITEHGYSPSYREIMNGLSYTSVATVALHVNSLIKRGHLQKRGRSARSLEVVAASLESPARQAKVTAGEEKWLVDKVNHFFSEAESSTELTPEALDHLYVLIGALKVLGLEGAAQSFIPRLTVLKEKTMSAV